MSARINFGSKIGLIGDAHGNIEFLIAAVHQLAAQGVTSIVQLGDFGLIWGRGPGRKKSIQKLECLLSEHNLTMYVVLGNHEDYDEIASLDADESGNRPLSNHLVLLSRAGRATAGERSVGWLSGAGSIDYLRRTPGISWWGAEIPTDADLDPLYDGEPVSVLFAHDALATPNLMRKLSGSAHRWNPVALAYTERTQLEFTQRALAALDDTAVVLSGHYHFPFREVVRLARPNGEFVDVEQVIFNAEWEGLSLGTLSLDGATLSVEHQSVQRSA